MKTRAILQPSLKQQMRLVARLSVILALVVVLFAALYWALGYLCGEGLKAGSGKPSLLDCIYFSVVTVATLGYGDIVPVGWSRLAASMEVVFGLIFFGYAISQLVSARQEALVDYLANDRVIQTYDECLAKMSDARELIADRRRAIQAGVAVDDKEFIYNRLNPFYPALRAIEILNGYTAHVEEIGRTGALTARVERAAHHVEELAGFVRKYVNLLIAAKVDWKAKRTLTILSQLCDAIDKFSTSYVIHTRYATQQYKGAGMYADIVNNLTKQIREKRGAENQ